MRSSHLLGFILATLMATGCASTRAPDGGGDDSDDDAELPVDRALRHALSGVFHGYWTGAASGTVLRARDGALLEIPVVLTADLEGRPEFEMDASDYGEVLLERSGHYNSSVWFVSSDIEVVGRTIYITKFEDSYEDTLCLELVDFEGDGTMRFQAHSFLADPGEGERESCLGGAVQYDATLLLRRGPGNSPEFIENGRSPGNYGAAPDDGESDEGGDEAPDDGFDEGSGLYDEDVEGGEL